MRTVAQQLGIADLRVILIEQRQSTCKERVQRIDQFQFVLQRQLDIDALHAVAIVAHARQRNDHVFVQLEGVGVLGNGGSARTVQPEFFARLGGNRDKAFAAAQVGETHNFRGGLCHRIFIIAHHIGQQHHLGAGTAFGFGGIAHRLQIAVVQMFEACQHRQRMTVDVVLDLHNRRYRLTHLAEKLQTHGAGVGMRAVQNKTRRGDDAVAAFFLDAGQAGEEFVGDVLAQSGLAEFAAGDVQNLGCAMRRCFIRFKAADTESGHLNIVNLAEVVVEAFHRHPQTIRRHHAP